MRLSFAFAMYLLYKLLFPFWALTVIEACDTCQFLITMLVVNSVCSFQYLTLVRTEMGFANRGDSIILKHLMASTTTSQEIAPIFLQKTAVVQNPSTLFG